MTRTAEEHLNRIESQLRLRGGCSLSRPPQYACPCVLCAGYTEALESLTALRATIAEMNADLTRLSRNETTVERLINAAHEWGWDGVNNSKLLDVFLIGHIAELKAQIAALERVEDSAQCELDKLLAYAREVTGRRDVHSIYEVLDQVPQLQAKIAELERKHSRAREWSKTFAVTADERDERISVLESALRSVIASRAKLHEQGDHLRQWLDTLDSLPAALSTVAMAETGSPAIPSAPSSEAANRDRAIKQIMIGGNHLASALIGWLGAGEPCFPSYSTSLEDARKTIADVDHYDAWVCWKLIMQARDLMRTAPPNPESPKEDADAPKGLPNAR